MTDHNFMKRMAPFLVLEILKKYTDEEHGLKASQIVELMEKGKQDNEESWRLKSRLWQFQLLLQQKEVKREPNNLGMRILQ